MSNSSSSPTITITPDTALIDESVSIVLTGFAPNLPVTIRARTSDDLSRQWESRATFLTDAQGRLDIASQAPTAGTYDDADAMGLFWSMHPVVPFKRGEATYFVKTKLETPTLITFDVLVENEVVASTQVTRLYIAPGVLATQLNERGLVGTLYAPATPGSHPALLVLSGSDGRIRAQGAALLASHGYAALALVYFGSAGVPDKLANIPLEYFETAITWLQERPEVDSERIGVTGTSRGGELALLLGATFPQIKAVIASAPSNFVHGAVSFERNAAAWTYKGEPLYPIPPKVSLGAMLTFTWHLLLRRPFVNRPMFMTEFSQPASMQERATIPVEKTQGPILLISGEADQLWPSTLYSDLVIERLRQHHFPYSYTHLHYKGAGHFVGVPYAFPNMPPVIEPLPALGMLLAFGGTAKESAFANTDSWQHTLTFLSEAFETPSHDEKARERAGDAQEQSVQSDTTGVAQQS